jgi:DNA-directed RNA polymerase subunit L
MTQIRNSGKLNAEILQLQQDQKAEHEKIALFESNIKPNVIWKLALNATHYTNHEIWGTELKVSLNGRIADRPVDEIIPSIIKHVIMSKIVTYGIGYGQISIAENTSCFDEHYIHRRMCQLPVPGIVPDIMVLDPTYQPYVKGDCGTLAADRIYPRHPNDKKEIRLSLNVEHTEDSMRDVTTNDLKCYLNDKEVKLYDPKYPILLLKLRKNEKISMQMMPALGFGDLQNCWNPVSNAFVGSKIDEVVQKKAGDIDIINKDGFTTLTLRSLGQISEKELIIRACKLVNIRMRRNIRMLSSMIDAYSSSIVLDFTFDNEGPELGELLTYLLSLDTKNVVHQSYLQEHPQIQKIKLHIKTAGKNPVRILTETMATIRDIYGDIGEQARNIPDKAKKITIDLNHVLRA